MNYAFTASYIYQNENRTASERCTCPASRLRVCSVFTLIFTDGKWENFLSEKRTNKSEPVSINGSPFDVRTQSNLIYFSCLFRCEMLYLIYVIVNVFLNNFMISETCLRKKFCSFKPIGAFGIQFRKHFINSCRGIQTRAPITALHYTKAFAPRP